MMEVKNFLKVLQKSGYPNPNPDALTISRFSSYPLESFIKNLSEEIGMEKTHEFIEKVFSSLGLTYHPGLKLELGGGDYMHLIINEFDLVKGEGEDITEVWIHYSFGENRLTINDDTHTTLADIWDEADMGDMGEVSEIQDEIQDEFRDYIYAKTGIIIHFDSEI
jgi:hypothetical protein